MKSDTQLQLDVGAELLWEPSVPNARIGVEVKDGIVTLAGRVDSYIEKLSAERAAQRVSGVVALVTEITVQIPGGGERSDADIAGSVENVLAWTSRLPKGAIQVMVQDGWVTLSGDVDWQYQRLAAAATVRFLLGVTGVSNQIAIRRKVFATVIKADIEAALKRSAAADARAIVVEVHDGNVTLTGRVASQAERETATASAWGSPGVHNVVDRMTLGQ